VKGIGASWNFGKLDGRAWGDTVRHDRGSLNRSTELMEGAAHGA